MKLSTHSAFSLPEVALALALTAFCLVAIFGLLPVALNSNQASIEETAANGILSTVISDMRATRPVSADETTDVASKQFKIGLPVPPLTAATDPTISPLYFNQAGQPVTEPAEARYRMHITFLPNQTGQTAPAAPLYSSLEVMWPAQADPKDATGSVKTFVAMRRR